LLKTKTLSKQKPSLGTQIFVMTFVLTVFVFNNIIHEIVHIYTGLGLTCVEIQGVEMLTLISGLCYVVFINPVNDVAGIRRQRLALSSVPN
jgi:hypothetical protein